MASFSVPSSDEIRALCPGFYLGSDSVPDNFKFVNSRDYKASVLVSTKAVDEPIEFWGVFKISKDGFTFTPTAGYDMSNKPAYDNHKDDAQCWLNIRPAVNLLAHTHETVLDGTLQDWKKYVSTVRTLESQFKDTRKATSSGIEHQSILIEDWGIKISHKFLTEKPESAKRDSSDEDSETETGGLPCDIQPNRRQDLTSFTEFTLEKWPVPDSWSDARETLLERNYAIRPLQAYLHGKTELIRPSRYERKLKGAIAHVSFILLAYNFEKDKRVRFSAVARRITVLVPPKTVKIGNSPQKRKESDTTEEPVPKKVKTTPAEEKEETTDK
ncbi:hypothetical protein M378DRAFT_180395 [Amanita muscaria Koide BX008]|uniref:Uncharacterized protein n=1 Tax=Amanita muscaria (strain Koide BX008) TaxID=946122 RepID=A0A0C2SCE8_AMAMK|nr:hypothetical protein M378DRAFT_180395 [Amanita muscaria Koide BX008]